MDDFASNLRLYLQAMPRLTMIVGQHRFFCGQFLFQKPLGRLLGQRETHKQFPGLAKKVVFADEMVPAGFEYLNRQSHIDIFRFNSDNIHIEFYRFEASTWIVT